MGIVSRCPIFVSLTHFTKLLKCYKCQTIIMCAIMNTTAVFVGY